MSRFIANNRAAFNHQPAHHILFDLGFPMTTMQIRATTAAVQNVLSLACSIRGGTRIPGFGISVINNNFQNVYQLEAIRGNFSKIVEALSNLENLAPVNERLSIQDFKDCLNLAISSILNDFNSKFDSVPSVGKRNFPAQLQITVVTRKEGAKTQEFLEELLQSMTTTKLRKIQVVELHNSTSGPSSQGDKSGNSIPKNMGFVDLIQLSEEESEIEKFLKSWLMDCNTDHEHISIVFQGRTSQEPLFTLKCDIKETLINPLSLPFGHRYQVQTDFTSIQLGGSGVAKVAANDLPIYKLDVIGRLSAFGLCESLIFGQPHRLVPTQCWRLEWTEQLTNQQCFKALCSSLNENEQYLLTRLQPQYRMDQLSGYFILISGDNSLLLKAVASAELVLPNLDMEKIFSSQGEDLPDTVLAAVNGALHQLPVINEYSPDDYPSGLYSALGRNLFENSSTIKDSKRAHAVQCHPALEPTTSKVSARGRAKRGRFQQNMC
ncbi:meiosis 1 arrest protein [Anabrus simplex]|uniref:meiosis 1 arrest protein n=1 Tax=Anabrus simplex TaxID=316456 RepID=UPI0035A37C19